ncbi:hypothetical protein Kpol_1058p37 [Vanderwaltozyma polyspora DSM 70294]|uniref:Coatomer subunit zeta n=1 Tax=Vanderwaltozyma polyspora (strain ATCC 22028 / DSM 70294 / BCRC 21397 / CBS 2163 / NBRC 10782 / NRRL Y-8283 / UCD 57-17) TaxID=436907 RepID=A7TJS1_VANPO|nr:uncharacterized protein Kpol_1058p37 [Vanderwaltozyma polyspora DSM 70294]EDO17500.1 hypothetical protein Kpol_1058p37 [Vanderwaltozyma polyspora DSM 70294]
MSSLSLYCVEALLILDGTGDRVYAKYYQPPHSNSYVQNASLIKNVKKQKEFEKRLFGKIHKHDTEILIFEDHIVLYKEYMDIILCLVGSIDENEVILQQGFTAFRDSLDLILDSGIDKKNIQDHFDMVLLAIDETIDNGIILETDPATIASRVTKPPTNEPQLHLDLDKGLMGAWGFAKSKLQERLQQGL